MGKIKFNLDQQHIIDIRNANVLVSAAAGSGKTAVLTGRILSLIKDSEHPVDIDRMLILTFTNAAAAEMKERIRQEIEDALAENPEDENLWRQSALVSSAHVSTIDKFCLFVIRNNFTEINLDPGFRVMDEGEGKLLLRDSITDIFERHLADKNDADFRELVEIFSGDRDEKLLADYFVRMHNYCMSSPSVDEWLNNASSLYRADSIEDVSKHPLYKEVLQIINGYIESGLELAGKTLDICCSEGGPSRAYKDVVETLYSLFSELKGTDKYSDRKIIFDCCAFPKATSAKTPGEDPELRAIVKKAVDRLKAVVEELRPIYSFTDEIVGKDSKVLLRVTNEIAVVLRELTEEFSARKRARNIIDYSDMEHMALQILSGPAGSRYRDYFDIIMVDEYQDSNYVQESIIKCIAREDNYFMVGDVKQSIYRFRQACPDLFMHKYETFGDEGENVRLVLNVNFRSRPEVLDFANSVFEGIMRKSATEIEYDHAARLFYGADYSESENNNAEVIILDNSEGLTESSSLVKAEGTYVLEAVMVAEKIKQMIADGYMVTDKDSKQLRRASYKDFVILLRSLDQVYLDVLTEMGIPAYMNETTGYFDATEVRTLLNYIRIIDNPLSDIPLYGALTSFFGGFTEEEIAVIKSVFPKGNLYEAMTEYDKEDEIKHKIDVFFATLEDYRHKSTYLPVRELLENIAGKSGYIDYVTALPSGKKRRANVLMLLEMAGNFEKTSYHGLFHFIRYIAQLKEKEVDYGESGVNDENSDVVRIMTIHKSKGLEFPICFLCNSSKTYNSKDYTEKLLIDNDYGLAMKSILADERIVRPNLQHSLLALKKKSASVSEEIRVLYVALTRAKEKMIVTAKTDSQKLFEMISEEPEKACIADILGANSYIKHIIVGLNQSGVGKKYIKYVNSEELKGRKDFEEISGGILRRNLEEADKRELSEAGREVLDRLGFEYAHKKLEGLYVKTSVSEIKRKALEETEEMGFQMFDDTLRDANEEKISEKENAPVPQFALKNEADNDDKFAQNNVGAAARGTAYHRVMELIPYAELTEKENWRNELNAYFDEMVRVGKITKEDRNLVKMGDIMRFMDSSLALRMRNADKNQKLFREKSFFLGISADRINREFPKDETMLVQGIIDAMFEEDDRIILVDYKTDRVMYKEQLLEKYGIQLDLYAEAIERIMNKKVSEKIIYSFALGCEICYNDKTVVRRDRM